MGYSDFEKGILSIIKMTISLEYLAGFFDGEGCINLTNDGYSINLRLLLYNSNYEILKAIQNQYGGRLVDGFNHLRNPRSKKNWTLRWGCKAAEDLIVKLLPYLIIKKTQAELALEFRLIKKLPRSERCCPNGLFGYKGLKLEILEKELKCKERMNILNKRGFQAKSQGV